MIFHDYSVGVNIFGKDIVWTDFQHIWLKARRVQFPGPSGKSMIIFVNTDQGSFQVDVLLCIPHRNK